MRSPVAVLFLSLPLIGVSAALALAGRRNGPPESHGPAAGAPAGFRPQFVHPADGWLPAGASDGRPAFKVGAGADLSEVYDLYPAKGAIRALSAPAVTTAERADWLPDQAPVLGLRLGTESRCYPLAVLNWHCLVMDRVGGQAIYVFWDPPSGLALARRARSASRPLGLAGYGYRGVGLCYDAAAGLLYDMLTGAWVNTRPPASGFGAGDTEWLPLERMTWRQWRRLHASTRVLSRDTGYRLDYGFDPYTAAALGPHGMAEDYWSSDTLLAPESLRDAAQALPDKSPVLGVLAGDQPWAVPLEALASGREGEPELDTPVGKVTVHAQPAEDWYYATDEAGHWLPQARLFWFAWKANFPATEVYQKQEAITTDD